MADPFPVPEAPNETPHEGTREASRAPAVSVQIRRLDPGLPLPAYAHPGDAGADLRAAHEVTLQPGERALVGTGVAIGLPLGYVGLVHPRSGLAARHGISIVNAPGTVDAGYRGEIQVNLPVLQWRALVPHGCLGAAVAGDADVAP